MKKFEWADFGSQKTKNFYKEFCAFRECMRGVSIVDFQRAFIYGKERLDFNKASREYKQLVWNDREYLIGRYLREPDFDGGPGTETDVAITEADMSWIEMNQQIDWRRLNAVYVVKRPYTPMNVSIFTSWLSLLDFPGFNRDSTIELTAEEFMIEHDRVRSIIDRALTLIK